MPSFTSAVYLGFRHRSEDLPAWTRLTTGMPAVLGEPPIARSVAGEVADLLGVERAMVARSTLHAAWDVVDQLSGAGRVGFLVDEQTYEILRWALEHAKARGIPVVSYNHRRAGDFERGLGRLRARGRRPIVVTDGWCPGCGRVLVHELVAAAARDDGVVLMDDTQAVGVLGRQPSAAHPYGRGGGGTMRWAALDPSRVVVIASLAKGFGAPLAVVGGPERLISQLAENGPTRVHASPPSSADLAAAWTALRRNRAEGDQRRRRLAHLVARLRAGLESLGLAARKDFFPVQPAGPFPVHVARQVHRELGRRGVVTALQRQRCGDGALVVFVVTATHQPSDVDRALAALARSVPSAAEARHAS